MENEIYEISPRSGRLRKRIKYKKHRPKKSLKSRLIIIVKHPIILFIIVAITGVFLYLSLQEPTKKGRKNPTAPSVGVNKKIIDNRDPE